MADMRRFRPADFLLLLLVFAVALGVRAGYLTSCADGGKSDGPLRVQEAGLDDQDVLIANVRQGNWFAAKAPFATAEETTAHVAPGYPYLVGLLGQHLGADQLGYTVRWIQVALGGLTAAFYFLFARRAFRSLAVGTVAGLFVALHPFWIIDTAILDDGTLASFALAGCLFLASQTGEKGGALKSLLLGASLAGLALVRASFLPFSFVALIWFLLRSRSLRLGWLCALCAFLGFGAALAPWTIRNYQLFNEPVPVISSTYLHLWAGNNPHANGGSLTGEMLETAPADELTAIPGQPARYARLGKEVAEEIRERPAETLRRRLLAGIAFVVGTRWLADGTLAEPTSATAEAEMPEWLQAGHPIALQGVLLGMLVLGLLGWRWSYGWRWESIPAALAVMWIPVPHVLGHAEGLSGPRLPLDGVLLCFAAFAVCCLLPRVGGHLLDAPEGGPKRGAGG